MKQLQANFEQVLLDTASACVSKHTTAATEQAGASKKKSGSGGGGKGAKKKTKAVNLFAEKCAALPSSKVYACTMQLFADVCAVMNTMHAFGAWHEANTPSVTVEDKAAAATQPEADGADEDEDEDGDEDD